MNAAQIFEMVRTVTEQITIPEENDTVILFGAGGLGVMSLSALQAEHKVTAFCDNDKNKVGTMIEGVPCISPAQLLYYPNAFVLIGSVKHYSSIHQQLSQMEIRHCSLDAYIVQKHWAEFESVFDILDDDAKKIYAGILLCRVSGDNSEAEKYFCGNPYFSLPKFNYLFQYGAGGGFIDCGAFVGDTVEEMIKHSLGSVPVIYAFEPNDRNYAALRKRVSFLCDIWALEPERIICENAGVGMKSAALSFIAGDQYIGTQITHNLDTTGNVRVVSIDEYLKEKGNPTIALIKADIESYEWDMLHGAKETIQRCKPKLAICIYHSVYDFFRIPLYLKKLVPEYHFTVRHHSLADEETMLYCFISERK